jgi:hypothetical protein
MYLVSMSSLFFKTNITLLSCIEIVSKQGWWEVCDDGCFYRALPNHLESKHQLGTPQTNNLVEGLRLANASLIEGMIDQKPHI